MLWLIGIGVVVTMIGSAFAMAAGFGAMLTNGAEPKWAAPTFFGGVFAFGGAIVWAIWLFLVAAGRL